MDKTELRRSVRQQIQSLNPIYLQKSNEGIFNNIISLPEYEKADTVFAYFSVKDEADTHRLIKYSLERRKKVALPVILGSGVMGFAITDGRVVAGSIFGIPEPEPDAPRVEPKPGDIIIVPALCFDLRRYRLGQGGGYYDRCLAKHSGVFSVGLCREQLLTEEVPAEEYDVCVDCVVTEIRTARSKDLACRCV